MHVSLSTVCHSSHQCPDQRGFTLIELAIVLLVVGLLLGTIMMPLATQFRIRETRAAQEQIEMVRQTLIGFTQSQGRVPCPDTDRDGLENGTAPSCGNSNGFLPHATLGLPSTDPWGHLYVYRVATEFTNTAATGVSCGGGGDSQLGLCDTGSITIFTRGDDSGTAGIQSKFQNNYATNAAVVIVSFGPNGFCGTRPDGTQMAPATGTCPTTGVTTTDEFENSDTDGNFVSRTYTEGGTGCSDTTEGSIFCEFDDLVVWIPTGLMLGKLVEAGQLP